jgi:hypothetical protein
MVVGGILVYRSQRKSAWDAEARGLAAETRTVIATRLPPVLTTTTVGQRGLTWPPVRDLLILLRTRWSGITDGALGETRRNWSIQVGGLLQDLIAAVDTENEALTTGRDRTVLRFRINQLEEAIETMLTGQARPEPPPAGRPDSPAFES